jgi:TolB-like protein
MALAALLVVLPAIAMVIALSSSLSRNRTAPAPGAAGVHPIAVLPFGDVASENNEYGLWLTEALITRLGRIKRFKVLPASEVLKYNGRDQNPVAAGRDMGVEWVIEGSLIKSGETVRVTARQVSVETAESLWSESFEAKAADLFMVADRISEKIARSVTSDKREVRGPESEVRSQTGE